MCSSSMASLGKAVTSGVSPEPWRPSLGCIVLICPIMAARYGWTRRLWPHYARAIVRWMSESGIASAHVVGHSLGWQGRDAISAESCVAGQPLGGRRYRARSPTPRQHSDVFEALLQVVEARCQSRQAADEVLANLIEDPGVRGYLLMGLERRAGAYDWRFNVKGLLRGYARLCAAPAFETLLQVKHCFSAAPIRTMSELSTKAP